MKAKKPVPASAGYSGTPLIKKLGIKSGMRACFINAPAHYGNLLGPLPDELTILKSLRGPLDFIHAFSTQESHVLKILPILNAAMTANGMLWISWPKQTSKIESDLNENIIRQIALDHGLVDVKVCAVDEDWSGLQLVYRLKDRPTKPKAKPR